MAIDMTLKQKNSFQPSLTLSSGNNGDDHPLQQYQNSASSLTASCPVCLSAKLYYNALRQFLFKLRVE